MTTPLPPAAVAAELATDALHVVGRLRRLWPSLAEARHRGKPGTHLLVSRRMSQRQLEAETYAVRRDRFAAAQAIRAGRTPSGEHPAPARVGPLHARTVVAALVRSTARRLHVPTAVTDPGSATGHLADCPWCAGTGQAQIPAGWAPWAWPTEPVACFLCKGHGRRCTRCGAHGACGCTLADAIVDTLLDGLALVLPKVTEAAPAAAAARDLQRAERAARNALGIRDTDLRVITAPCPACDRKELAADVTSPKRQEWSVSCQSVLCRCEGPGCSCGRPVRWPGRKHRWPSWEFNTLADTLGVTLPALA